MSSVVETSFILASAARSLKTASGTDTLQLIRAFVAAVSDRRTNWLDEFSRSARRSRDVSTTLDMTKSRTQFDDADRTAGSQPSASG